MLLFLIADSSFSAQLLASYSWNCKRCVRQDFLSFVFRILYEPSILLDERRTWSHSRTGVMASQRSRRKQSPKSKPRRIFCVFLGHESINEAKITRLFILICAREFLSTTTKKYQKITMLHPEDDNHTPKERGLHFALRVHTIKCYVCQDERRKHASNIFQKQYWRRRQEKRKVVSERFLST